ncbi:winged helix-turn-helix transcriptional regulator [Devosia sp.]|uniref:winged helix-turn-helix transcriptional regulator n=1 Tax=Devosia sp. TaxID=1871048 RepID=UPI0037C0E2E9
MLGLLTAVDQDATLTQRGVAARLGIALGMANAYLKRCIRKGLVKVSQIPRRRYAYYLTPQGLSEKTRLTAEYFSNSLRFFRMARVEYAELLNTLSRRQAKRVAFCGVSELSEIASLCAGEAGVEVAGILDLAETSIKSQVGHLVVSDVRALGVFDAILITDFIDGPASLEKLQAVLPAECILAPKMLGLSTRAAGAVME